jgi:hypothetical protein
VGTLRGETVGTAYVRILADGSGLPRSIKDEIDKAEPVMEGAGQRHSKAYSDAFEKEMKKSGEKKISKSLNEGIGRSDAIEKMFSGPEWERFTKRLERQFGDVGVLIGHNIQEGVRDSGDLGTISHRLSNISGEIRKAQSQIEVENDKVRQAAIKWERDFRRQMDETTHDFLRTLSSLGPAAKKIETAFQGVGAAVGRIRIDAAKEADRVIGRVGKTAEEVEPHISKLRHGIDEFGNAFGKAFGKGSRNNFVNFIGSFVSAPIKAISAVVGGLEDAGRHIQDTFTKAGGGLSGFGAVAAEVGKSGAAGLAVLAGIVLISGPVVGAISSIAAALVALASSISFALVGALGAVAGLLPVVAFGLGTVALAFVGMSKASKTALAESIKPMVKEFKDLRKVAQEGIVAGINKAAPILGKSLKGITPLIKDISGAIGDVIVQFAKATTSKGFQDFIKAMDQFIPGAIRQLGTIAKNTIGGIGGIFEGLTPSSKKFLDWLEKITKSFSDWSNSAKGQNQIKSFMDKALDSTRSLWDLLKQVGTSLGLLLFGDSGKKAGDSIIDDMSAKVKSFNDWLRGHPKALEKWFADGKSMAEAIGRAIEGIIKTFDKLDTPENRSLAKDTVGALAAALKILPFAISASGLPELIDLFGLIKKAAVAMKDGVRNAFADMVDAILGKLSLILHGAEKAFGWLPPLHNKLKAAADAFDEWRNRVNDSIRGVKQVTIGITIDGGQEAIDQIATLQHHLNGLPKSTTVGVLYKVQRIPVTAMGAVVVGPQVRMVGEAGPEAIVPLNRPLSQVDPAVRALSAIAQGKTNTTTNNNGHTVNVGGLTVVTPTKDPAAVARETVNQLVAASYI